MYGKYSVRLSAVCLCLLLMLQLVGCGGHGGHTDATEKTSSDDIVTSEKSDTDDIRNRGEKQLKELRETMKKNGMVAAVCFVGYAKGNTESVYDDIAEACAEEYPVIAAIPEERWVVFDGVELYCIIPADENATVAVNEWICDENNGYVGETGRVLYRSEEGKPIMVRGNISDAVSNLQVLITQSGDVGLEFHPSLSLYDRKLNISMSNLPYILDFTDYSKNLPETLDGINTFGTPSPAVEKQIRQHQAAGWSFPDAETLIGSCRSASDADWYMEFQKDERDYPYTGYVRIYRMSGGAEAEESSVSGKWIIKNNCLILRLQTYENGEFKVVEDAFPTMILNNGLSVEIHIFKGNRGSLLPFMNEEGNYAALYR